MRHSYSVREMHGMVWAAVIMFTAALGILGCVRCHGGLVDLHHPSDFHITHDNEIQEREVEREKELDRMINPDCSSEERRERDKAIEQGSRLALTFQKMLPHTVIKMLDNKIEERAQD